jgi:hypothetical protein
VEQEADQPGEEPEGLLEHRLTEFIDRYRATYPAAMAMEILDTDRESLTAYLRFPVEHPQRIQRRTVDCESERRSATSPTRRSDSWLIATNYFPMKNSGSKEPLSCGNTTGYGLGCGRMTPLSLL